MSPIQLDALETRCNIFIDQIKEVAGQQKILNAGEAIPQKRQDLVNVTPHCFLWT